MVQLINAPILGLAAREEADPRAQAAWMPAYSGIPKKDSPFQLHGQRMDIRVDALDGTQIIQLLREHVRSAALHSPPTSVHALDIEGLRHPDITFWSAWEGAELLGCAALRQLDARHGEIKSMRTATLHQRKGVAAGMMLHLLEQARLRSYHRLSLETGSMDAFAPARGLYARFGFERCGPFSQYVSDPHSVFMTREL